MDELIPTTRLRRRTAPRRDPDYHFRVEIVIVRFRLRTLPSRQTHPRQGQRTVRRTRPPSSTSQPLRRPTFPEVATGDVTGPNPLPRRRCEARWDPETTSGVTGSSSSNESGPVRRGTGTLGCHPGTRYGEREAVGETYPQCFVGVVCFRRSGDRYARRLDPHDPTQRRSLGSGRPSPVPGPSTTVVWFSPRGSLVPAVTGKGPQPHVYRQSSLVGGVDEGPSDTGLRIKVGGANHEPCGPWSR